jgi:DNA polymerase-3 subunit gamma/tau
VKFIFATTEPDKVLGTIRSPHAPLPVPVGPPGPDARVRAAALHEEGIEVAPACCPSSCARAAARARDTLSLLDQLIAGSEGTTIDYERAVALLGYTHGALLDEVVDAIGARMRRAPSPPPTGGADRQDPRRFVEDLLERLRDLIVVAAIVARDGGCRAARRPGRRARAHGRAGGRVRLGRALAGRRPRQPDPHRDDRRPPRRACTSS